MPITPYTNQSYQTLNTTPASGMSAGTGLAAMSMIQGLSGAYSSYQQAALWDGSARQREAPEHGRHLGR